MTKSNFLIVLIDLLMMLCSQRLAAARGELQVYQGDQVAPHLQLSDMQGRQHSLEDYRGQIVLLQFWAAYCAPCRTEMPSMNRLVKRMQGKAFSIVTVNMAESKDQIQKSLDEVPVDFPVLMDHDGSTLGRWKVFAAPANFILDINGKIIYALYGAIEWDSDDMVKTLTELADA